LPVATITAVGVAKERAEEPARSKSVTKEKQAKKKAGEGPNNNQTRNVTMLNINRRGIKIRTKLSAKSCKGVL